MNIFEIQTIPYLISVIGEQQLNSIQVILNVIGDSEINPNLIHSKSFLANYVRLVYGSKLIGNRRTLEPLIEALNTDQLKDISALLNSSVNGDRSSYINSILSAGKSKKGLKTLSNYFDIDFYETDNADFNKIDSYLIPKNPQPYKQLKDYQFEVMFKALTKLENPYSRFILQMPTGSGKTRTAMEIVCSYLNENPDASVVWLAHSTELCEQASACFLEVWPHIAKKEIYFKRHYGAFNVNQSDYEDKIDFLCAGFQSVYSELKNNHSNINLKLHSKRLIIVDEAHKAVAKTYQFSIKKLMSEGSNVMGLTATPGRSYKSLNSEDENRLLSEFFFDELVSFEAPKDISAIEYLRNKGVLANVNLEVLKTDGSITFNPRELNSISESFELPADVLMRLGKDNIRNAEIIQRIIQLVKNDGCKSVIYFATSLDQSKLISAILSFLKVKSVHIDGDSPSHFREQSIEAFREQTIEVLCNYEVLATGFDAPLVDCVFIARPTASVVLYSQMIGRGLRGPAIGGKDECRIVNVRDNFINLPSINEMYRIFDAYWLG
jgi:superfamily II DNA or RNA helicase